MTNGVEAVDQEMLSTIKRHAGVGNAVGILAVIAGVLAVMSPLIAGLSVAIAVGVLLMIHLVTSRVNRDQQRSVQSSWPSI
jgi:uncharacterized membrane protein HdeD (DUF308 family)